MKRIIVQSLQCGFESAPPLEGRRLPCPVNSEEARRPKSAGLSDGCVRNRVDVIEALSRINHSLQRIDFTGVSLGVFDSGQLKIWLPLNVLRRRCCSLLSYHFLKGMLALASIRVLLNKDGPRTANMF